MPSSKTVAALGLLVLCGPILVFPDVLPEAWRTGVVTLITLTALVLGLVMLELSRELQIGLWLFVAALAASWAFMPTHDLVGLRHFSGVSVGILAMAFVAAWCTTTDRLVAASGFYTLASIGVLSAGLLGTSINLLKFVGHTPLLESPPFTWLPGLQLGLPGLEENGQVNANALGGTALLLLPTCGATAAAALLDRHRHRLVLATGVVATTLAMVTLVLTLSRTAWVAGLLTLAVWGLRWRRGRLWIFVLVCLVAGGMAVATQQWQGPYATKGQVLRGAQFSVRTRLALWHDGFDRLAEAPLLGVGINQFHEVTEAAALYGSSRVAHVHNMLLQVALDVGVPGLSGYVLFFMSLVLAADGLARGPGVIGRVAGGAGLSIVAVHLFGLGDAIALGAKVGLFQWLCAGLVLAALRLPPTPAPVDLPVPA